MTSSGFASTSPGLIREMTRSRHPEPVILSNAVFESGSFESIGMRYEKAVAALILISFLSVAVTRVFSAPA
ncbi:hypothetical protein FIBSPDRAFT_879966 [Athelia psychrophila]|uniref:Uncharacterized protein n=1 Tax=Athelia psychrophila TaxID=1759441 RepID=A0A167TET9_9AGAM|nr:hypothetical protein FIBSPDRAFT_879966 [Fibularhizoctonia sp. CBS 109695]